MILTSRLNKKDFENLLIKKNIDYKEIALKCDISSSGAWKAINGANVQWITANKISIILDMKMSDLFKSACEK